MEMKPKICSLKGIYRRFRDHVSEDLKYTQSTGSSINTKFRSSNRTLGIDGADVVLGPDIVIA